MNSQSDTASNQSSPFGFFSNGVLENPFPMLEQIRAQGGVVPLPLPGADSSRRTWMVTRMDEAVQVLKDHRHFTVDPSRIGIKFHLGGGDGSSEDRGLFTGSMIFVDEPDHRRLRGLVSKGFTPKFMESLRPHVQQLADELIDRVQDQGAMDLVHDYAFPLPINVISDMLGVPVENRARIRALSESLISGNPGEAMRGDSRREYVEYVSQIIEEKRRNPQDDLISRLIELEEGEDRLSVQELISMISLLIFAGHETTSNLIGIGTLMLLDHPEQFERLKADPSLVPSAVEEMLRFNGPVFATAPRFAVEDIAFGGQQISRGDFMFIVLSSANRDESQFTQPEDLEIARQLNRHVAFGQGIHICLGAPLARLEADIAFTTLLRRLPNLRLNVPRESVTWRVSSTLRGIMSLPVAF
jgi:cytochrome P450